MIDKITADNLRDAEDKVPVENFLRHRITATLRTPPLKHSGFRPLRGPRGLLELFD